MTEYHEWMRIAKATRGIVCRAQTAYFMQLARVAKRIEKRTHQRG